jgi:hypothetical protein
MSKRQSKSKTNRVSSYSPIINPIFWTTDFKNKTHWESYKSLIDLIFDVN